MAPTSHRKPESGPPQGRRPDESMTLLISMMERPLDPGYAAAAREREEAGLPPSTGVRTVTMFVAAAVTGLLLTLGALALRAPSTSALKAKAELVAQVQARRTAADAQEAHLRSLQAEVTRLQNAALGSDASAIQSELAAQSLAAGAEAVRGPGIRVVLDDAPTAAGSSADGNPRTSPQGTTGKVLSKDVQVVVDGLWQAGAEAIAINGQRLTSKSAIRFAGEAILVNYRPLSRPYTIDVVGDPAGMQANFAANDGGSYARALKDNYGIRVSIDPVDRLTLPPATTLAVRYATVPQPSTPTPTESSP